MLLSLAAWRLIKNVTSSSFSGSDQGRATQDLCLSLVRPLPWQWLYLQSLAPASGREPHPGGQPGFYPSCSMPAACKTAWLCPRSAAVSLSLLCTVLVVLITVALFSVANYAENQKAKCTPCHCSVTETPSARCTGCKALHWPPGMARGATGTCAACLWRSWDWNTLLGLPKFALPHLSVNQYVYILTEEP